MKKVIISLLMVMTGLLPLAAHDAVINGVLVDSQDTTELIEATVKLLMANKDSTMVKGTTTDLNGVFNMKGVKPGKYLLRFSYLGYNDVIKHVTVGEDGRDVNIGVVTMDPNTIMLKETVVVGVKSPIVVKEDTIEFNADTYKTQANAVVEDLLKRLPGVEVGSDGKITANGKEVKKILIDGKEFFNDDPTVASKNIPADMINKLQVIDRKSDLARLTGVDDGDDETVINLTVKKGMNNGWFGNFDAGYGTEKRYSERLMLNRFTEQDRYTLLGGANNTGERGFGGGRGWGGNNNGLRSMKNAGFDFSTNRTKLELGGSFFYRYNGTDTWNQSAVQSFVTSRGAFSNSESLSRSSAHNWNLNFRMEWKPDSMTNIIFRPSGSLSRNKGYNTNQSATFNEDPNDYTDDPLKYAAEQFDADEALNLIVNTNTSLQQTYTDSRRIAGELQLNRRLNNEGRNITLRTTGNASGSDSKQLSAAQIRYKANDSETINNRYYTTPGRSRAFSAQLTYSEPIAKKTYLQFSYRFNYSYNKSDRQAFTLDPVAYTDLAYALGSYRYDINGAIDYMLSNGHKLNSAEEDEAANKLSQYSVYKNFDHTFSVSFRKVTDAYNFSAGIDLLPQRSVLDYKYMGKQYPTITRNVFNFAPNVDLRYNFDKQTNLRVSYRGRTSQPSMTNLLDITDDSNPLNITKGNPGLKPSFSHNINFNYHSFKMEHQRGIFAWGGVSMTQNSIANRTSYDATTGVSTTRPENINGNWDGRFGGGFNTSLDKNNYFTFDNFTSLNYNHRVSYLDPKQYTQEKSKTNTFGISEDISFGFRKDWFEISLNGDVNYNTSRNSVLTTGNLNTWDFSYGADMNLNFNNGISFSTDISENSRRGYASSSMNTNELIWNAQVSKSFLKGNALTVSLQWNDILQKRSNISRAIDSYRSSDSRYNAIYSYGMVHVIYKLNIFGGKNAHGTNNGMPPMGGWGGGRPGGGWR